MTDESEQPPHPPPLGAPRPAPAGQAASPGGGVGRATAEGAARPAVEPRGRVALAYAACVVIWGTTFYAIRACIGPGGYPTYQAAALRFVLAALALAALAAAGRARPAPRSPAQAASIGAAGLLNFVSYALLYKAEEAITGGLACVLYGTLPLMTALLAAATGTERASRASVAGALVSIGGVAILFQDRLEVSARQAAGVAMLLGAVTLSTCMNIVLKRKAGGVHPLAQSAWFLGATAVAMTALAAAEGRPLPWPPPPGPTLALLYLAVVGSVVAFAAYFYLIRNTSLMVASTIVLLEPLVALVVDAAWEAQPIGGAAYLGAAVTMGGVGVSTLLGRRPR
ncbi:MAG TPA: DMT family transporter [Polyangiaceae bacterium]|nr:DMT family transporter [Polyangiaceae bacterium]